MGRPEVFDVRCRLHFYSPQVCVQEEVQRFMAVPEDPSTRMILRGMFRRPVSTLCCAGRLYGIRRGSPTVLWTVEAVKAEVPNDGTWLHDLVDVCRWDADREQARVCWIDSPASVLGTWFGLGPEGVEGV